MKLLIAIGRLTVGFRSDTDGTLVAWRGRRGSWWISPVERHVAPNLLGREAGLVDSYSAKRNDGALTIQAALGAKALWYEWRPNES